MRDEKGRFIKGHFVPPEWRKKVSELATKNKYNEGHKHSAKTKKKISENRKGKACGKDNGWWRGGISRVYKTGYYSTEYKEWRKAVFERDNYVCQKCGLRGNKVFLTAHHIKSFAKFPALRYNVNNGLTLCEDCHKLTDNYKGRNK